jgi:hypothetical protein
MNCNKTSNNKYFDCPALMSDGRIMTDYRQSCTVNDMIRLNNNVLSSNDYRQFLINNAEDIININQDYIVNKNGCKSGELVEVPFSKVCKYTTQYGKCEKTNQRVGLGIANQAESNINTCGNNQHSGCYFNDAENMNVNANFFNGKNTDYNQYSTIN